jgi:hypothetical protein
MQLLTVKREMPTLKKKNGLLNVIFSCMEKRRLRRSFGASFIAGTGRDSYQYYENGRSVEIYAEMMLGHTTRRIHRQNLKWSDNGEALTATQQAEVLSRFCEYLDRQKIKWEFYGSENPAGNQ